ncbi:bifunctional DNA-formamidopyrimidine glycosylase/DNA-(apurinic or apyrimidinic site) lyase [Marisediminicola sp. LYQ134]|uniref:bifunctional DNA-formamidopyrimidine glycosylase/DNA-(apurinic or apyrimidinic site) lyase n=1 Tax=Marisediminicola sp. LYQ134 TaxID=3391061 RepID=UPI003982F7F5
MPELPEVEVVRAGLAPAVSGATITAVTIFDERSLRRHEGPAEDFVERLVGSTISVAARRGKFLWFPLLERDAVGSATALVAHLGMSGQMLLRDRQTDDRLTRIRFDFAHPEHGALRLNFVDQRIFGSMAIDSLVATRDGGPGGFTGDASLDAPLVPSHVAHIARDPLDPAFDDDRFLDALASKSSGIKRVLLDQRVVSGIGNIYADESLWAAKVHFDQPASRLSRRRARTLLGEVREVLAKALLEGGTSFDSQYVNVNGASGYFSHSLNAYGQQGKPCPRCGRPIRRIQFMNRGSHLCTWCQRLTR